MNTNTPDLSHPATRRAAIVAEARLWLGTPFHHQARLRGVGVDCAGLVIGVARSLGLVPAAFDVTAYERLPSGGELLRHCGQHMAPVAQAAMQPGDVIVVAFDADPQHLGIIAPYRHGGLSLIHSFSHAAGGGRVIETRLLFSRAMRFVQAYEIPAPGGLA